MPADILLQGTIDLQTPGVTGPQVLLALLVLAFAIVLLLTAQYLTRFAGLPEEESRHASALAMQLDAKTPTRLRLPIDTNFAAKRYQIRDLWTIDETDGGHARTSDEPPTVREALGELHTLLLERWGDNVSRFPLYSIRLAEEAIVLLILGALAVLSIERWESALSVKTPVPAVGDVVHDLHELTVWTLEAGAQLLALFPYGGVVWSLLFAHAVLLYDWLYHHWFVLAAILFIGAAVIAYLDQYVEETDARLIQDRRTVAASAATAVLGVWVAGVIPTGLGVAAGAEHFGAIIGFLFAFTAAIAATGYATRELVREVKAAARWYVDDEPSIHIAAYLLVRRVWGVFAVIGATLIPVYLIVILAGGRIFDLIGLWGHASTEVQLLAGLIFLAALAAVAMATREAWPDLGAALRSKLGEQSIRRALFGRGAPFGVMVIVYLIAVGMAFPVGVAVLLAIVAGTATRGLYILAARVKYRAQQHDDPMDRPAMVYIEAVQVEDADGREHYVARVNGELLARSYLSAIVDEVVEQAASLRDTGEYTATFGRYHADGLLQHGIVDEDRSEYSLKREITGAFEQLFEKYDGRVPPDAVDDELEEYPDEHLAEKKRELKTRGADGWRLAERDGYLVRV